MGQLYVVCSIVFILLNFRYIVSHKYRVLIILYFVLTMFSYQFIQHEPMSYVFTWSTPLFVAMCVEKKDSKYYKYLAYLLIAFFVLNAITAFYERVTHSYIMPPEINDTVLNGQMNMYDKDIHAFRAFALMGHPLTNALFMTFSSFIIFYSSVVPDKVRIIVVVIGLSSLFCFNARAALMIALLLFVPSFYYNIKHSTKYKLLTSLVVIVSMYFLFAKLSVIGGRLMNGELLDESAMVRVATWELFCAIPFNELIYGGTRLPFSENGWISILASFGLLIGGFKIFVELFLSVKLQTQSLSLFARLIISASIIVLGNTNNALEYPIAFPLYTTMVTIVLNNRCRS